MAATTVEQTGKWFKGWMVVAALIAIAGVPVIYANAVIGWIMVLGGFGLFAVARAAAWWEHG